MDQYLRNYSKDNSTDQKLDTSFFFAAYNNTYIRKPLGIFHLI